jgi:hypothetical protein
LKSQGAPFESEIDVDVSEASRSATVNDLWLMIIETPGKFLNVVLEKDGEDQLDRSCEK